MSKKQVVTRDGCNCNRDSRDISKCKCEKSLDEGLGMFEFLLGLSLPFAFLLFVAALGG